MSSNSVPMTEQRQANLTQPRALSEKGSPLWCWQTISALQVQWKSLNFDLDLYKETWDEAEEHKVWEKVPYDDPFGSKDEMLRRLEIGDVPNARVRVAEKAMDARPLGRHSGANSPGKEDENNHNPTRRRTKSDYLTARIARDRPDILERMKQGEFRSVAEAARAAGIDLPEPKKTLTLGDNVDRVADRLRAHYTPEQRRRIRELLAE